MRTDSPPSGQGQPVGRVRAPVRRHRRDPHGEREVDRQPAQLGGGVDDGEPARVDGGARRSERARARDPADHEDHQQEHPDRGDHVAHGEGGTRRLRRRAGCGAHEVNGAARAHRLSRRRVANTTTGDADLRGSAPSPAPLRARASVGRGDEEAEMTTSANGAGARERRREAPDRNLAMELVRVTEAAAMAAGRWVGRGDKNGGDGAAVDAMRQLIGSVSMRGVVVIGEGEKDEAPMLFNGEQVGNGEGPDCDVAVDPIDGTTLMAKGMPGSVAVLAVAERGAMFDPSAVFYMEKLAVGPEAADVIDITVPVGGEHPPGRAGQAPRRRRRHRLRARPPAARGAREGDPPHRRAHPLHLRRRRGRRDLGGPPEHRRRPARRHRRHPRGHHQRGRAQVHGRRDPGPAVAAGRRRAAEGPRRRPRPRPRAHHRRPRAGRQRVLLRHRRHRRRPAQGRALPRRAGARRSRS